MKTGLADVRAALLAALQAAQQYPVHPVPYEDTPSQCIIISDPTLEFGGVAPSVGTATWNIQMRYARVDQKKISNTFDAWLLPVLVVLSKGADCGFRLLSASPETASDFQVPAYSILGTTTVTLC